MKYGFSDSVIAPVSFATACFGFDTRETSPALIQAAMKGAELMGVQVTNHGICTTPMLHWLISEKHTKVNDAPLYYEHFKNKFLAFLSLCEDDAPK